MTPRQQEKLFKKFGQQCKKIRLGKGLTQEDMYRYGFSTRFYQRIEAGKHIHLSTAFNLAKAFKISLSELFNGL